ncbi:MAG: phosphoesterase PA-phosphatase related protein [Thermoleophilia bacterium]|jgi:acid phosphatase (class A)|nr:phosphoesterase PA-phosphatase related protein [Thermoleophilia bacterium]
MVIAPVAAASVPAPSTPEFLVDVDLVPGLQLPRVHNLPTPTSPGTSDLLQAGPPKPGTAAYAADMAAVKGAQMLRTPEGDAWARRMADDGQSKIWFDFAAQMRAKTGKVQGWLDTALLASTLATTAAITFVAKERHDRLRPYQVDPTIVPPVKLPHGDSFPSGHASAAFAAARVIATLAPSLAADAYALATQVAVSRVYAGVHFPTDVLAGAALGTAIGEAAVRLRGHRVAELKTAVAALHAA